MKVRTTDLPGVVVLEPRVFRDARGWFLETWQQDRYHAAGLPDRFVQDNVSRSTRGVVRGLHLQHPRAQGKLVSVLEGEVFDVAVDVRGGSPTFGRWVGVALSAENALQLYVPEGFAHGFMVTSDHAVFMYKCTEAYLPDDEVTVRWDDAAIGIHWPPERPVLSDRDAAAPLLSEIPPERLPVHG